MKGGNAMAYTSINFKTKKALKEAVKNGEQITVYNPSGMFETVKNGIEHVEGPHYPKPHRWYAAVRMEDGIIKKVIS